MSSEVFANRVFCIWGFECCVKEEGSKEGSVFVSQARISNNTEPAVLQLPDQYL